MMTNEELKEYSILAEERQLKGKLSRKKHKRYVELVNKSFEAGMPEIFKKWARGFKL